MKDSTKKNEERDGSIDVAGLDGGVVRLTRLQLANLRARIAGEVLRAADPGWDGAVLTWNAMVASLPALVLQPTSAEDVAAAIRFAREHRLLLSIKGGGHNIGGTSMAPRGLTLDMSRMRQVAVDPVARIAQVGPGCLLRDVDRATQQHGLATVLGFVSEVGVAGLTLGGGFGYLARRFGWAVDNLEEVDIATADGQIRTASREENADLFWAVRGGGGNFGAITRFAFRLHEVGPTITGGLILWSADRIDEVLAAYRRLTGSAPRELTAAVVVMFAPPAPFVAEEWHGKRVVAVLACHSGENPEADLAPLRALGDPIADLVCERPYVEQQSLVDDAEPKGLHYYWKTEFASELSAGFLDAFRAGALAMKPPLSQSVIFHIGGALNEHAGDDGAVGNRDAVFVTGFAGQWAPEENAGEHVAWVRSCWDAMRPFSTGGNYVNFQMPDDDDRRTAASYGANHDRLRGVKARYDPDNLFRVNRNIGPRR
jgi:FAD/FMN-containing dehydrogenase